MQETIKEVNKSLLVCYYHVTYGFQSKSNVNFFSIYIYNIQFTWKNKIYNHQVLKMGVPGIKQTNKKKKEEK